MEADWQEQLELREELNGKPSDLKRYEGQLKQATLFFATLQRVEVTKVSDRLLKHFTTRVKLLRRRVRDTARNSAL